MLRVISVADDGAGEEVEVEGMGLAELASVSSITDWEASVILSLTGDIPLWARSGDSSMALTVALS